MKRIAITTGNISLENDPQTPYTAVREQYLHYVAGAGAVPIVVPLIMDEGFLNEYVKICDGLMLTGGGDIHPKYYHRQKHELTGSQNMVVNTIRDEVELFLFKKFKELNKPILGICRGCQLINVAMGGTLAQDLHLIKTDLSENHLLPGMKYSWLKTKAHQVNIKSETKLSRIMGQKIIEVNSAHHQMVDQVGKNLVVSGESPQGIIETIEANDYPFMIGVQWHPEQLDDESSKRLIQAFTKAC